MKQALFGAGGGGEGACNSVMQLTLQETEVTLGKSVSQPGLHIAITWERLKKIPPWDSHVIALRFGLDIWMLKSSPAGIEKQCLGHLD